MLSYKVSLHISWAVLAQEGLKRHGLVRALNLGVVGRTALAREADVDAQGQQPQMEAGRKRGGRGVIVKDRSVIQGDTPGQAQSQEGTSEHELVGR